MQPVETLERLARLCSRDGAIAPSIEPTGLAALDALLPGGGWRSGTIVELMPTDIGIGELRLLMPALARMTNTGRFVALIAPPCIPFAPALAQHGVQLDRLLLVNARTTEDILWSFEQILRCKSFGAAVAWPPLIKDREIRRLQLAAEAGRNTGFMYRSPAVAREASPAAVRIRLQPCDHDRLSIEILKCRGARAGMSITAVGDWRLAVNEEGNSAPESLKQVLSDQPLTANR